MSASVSGPDRVLVAFAAELEAEAARPGLGVAPREPGRVSNSGWVLEQGALSLDLVVTGVGKAQAAAGVASVFDPERHAGVVSLGVGGLLTPGDRLVGSVVLASRSVFADEGVETPGGFVPIDSLGFPPAAFGKSVDGDADWVRLLGPLSDETGVVATVSACSGTDARAREVALRTGAVVEAMEGAAVAAAAAGLGATLGRKVRFAEIRVVSNTTGDRERQVWDLDNALAGIARVGRGLGEIGGCAWIGRSG